MDSEGGAVRRRMDIIASHFAGIENASSTLLLPLRCCNSLNLAIPRYDNRVHFARQSSASQAFFMRQCNPEKQPKCSAASQASRPHTCDVPLFSRPTNMDSNSNVVGSPPPPPSMVSNLPAVPDLPPQFSRPSDRRTPLDFPSPSQYTNTGSKWSPRMDVADCGSKYVVTVEIPGVNVRDIRVEVHDHNITIMGKRCWAQSWRKSVSPYHKKEILAEASFNLSWPLPSNANKDSVSADFLDRLLRVTIPKL